MEYKVTDNIGIVSKFAYSSEYFKMNSFLHASDLPNIFTTNTTDLQQYNDNIQSIVNNSIKVVYQNEKYGNHQLGYKFFKNSLENTKDANISQFMTDKQKYASDLHAITHNSSKFFGNLFLDLETEYAFVSFLQNNNKNDRKFYFQYQLKADYNLNQFTTLSAMAKRKLDIFPLHKIINGMSLIDFQTVFVPNWQIEPYYNQSYTFTFYKNFRKNRELSIAYLKGISDNLNNQTFNQSLIFVNADQLRTNLDVLSVSYKGKIKGIPLKYTIVPELLMNASEVYFNSEIKKTTAQRYMADVILNYNINNKFAIEYQSKYSHFMFKNNIQHSNETKFDFWSNKIQFNLYLLDDKFKSSIGYRQVNFMQNNTNFNNLDFNLVYKTEKMRYFLQVNNIFNSKYFITQDLNHALLDISVNSVFARYINLGLEFRIN